MSSEVVLKMVDIDKSFAGVHALDHVSFEVHKGEVHVLMGENGAGKSTLLKILAGIYQADSGEILLDGEKVDIGSPTEAKKSGITVIHQELSLCKDMTIAENIYRGNEPNRGLLHIVDFETMFRKSQELLDRLNMNLSSDMLVGRLSIAQQQMVEIASALSKDARIVVMDEPTASLTDREVTALFETIRELQVQGVSVIYVSHRMNETFIIGNRVTVLRDGRYIGTRDVDKTNADELVGMMVGRSLTEIYDGVRVKGNDEVILDVRNFSNKKLKNVSFQLRKGEILGFSGLVGAGRTELARALFGIDRISSGQMFIDGKPVAITSPGKAIRNHIGFIPEDRKGAGLILMQTIGFNLTIVVTNLFMRLVFINRATERDIIETYRKKLSIRSTGPDQCSADLSGGNQQKVVISKWLASRPKILIMDEPTRGIDVGAKAEIYHLMAQLAKEGISIIFISSDLPEIINMSSRVAIMREGELVGILDAETEELSQVKIMRYATGGMESCKEQAPATTTSRSFLASSGTAGRIQES